MPRKRNAKLVSLTLLLHMAALGAITTALTAPASAQLPMPSFSLGKDRPPPTPEERERQRQIDNAYKSATTKIPDKQLNDPWADVRQAPPAASKKKPQ